MKCAVLGDPVDHSLSPVLHTAGYAATGLAWQYDACRVPAGSLREFLTGLDDDWRGLSLTMPLKREALDLLDDRPGSATETVWRSGAANTLILDGTSLHADNTDVPGAVAALGERGIERLGRATILGGGATATSVGLALAGIGVRDMTMLVRTPERARETVRRLSNARVRVRVADLATAEVTGDLVVSTIPVVAQTDEMVARCAGVPAVFEVVYDPWPSPLAAAAAADGRVLVSGFDLLVHQAALQFVAFTGLSAPVQAMRAAGERALAVRTAG